MVERLVRGQKVARSTRVSLIGKMIDTTPKKTMYEVMERIRMLRFISCKRPEDIRPGETYLALPKDVKEQLRNLKSEDIQAPINCYKERQY